MQTIFAHKRAVRWFWTVVLVAALVAIANWSLAQAPFDTFPRPTTLPRGGVAAPNRTPLSRPAISDLQSSRRIPMPDVSGATPSENDATDAKTEGAKTIDLPSASESQTAAAKIFAAKFDDPASPIAAIDPASFSGIQPGDTAQQLADKWGQGKPLSRDGGETVLGFTVESFKHVEVTIADDKVHTVTVHLDQPLMPETLIRQLKLADVRPVNVPDDSGELLGQAFPERGVLFSLTPDGKRVAHVVIEKVDPAQFVLRAEMDLYSRSYSALADLNYALSRQPQNARALWLRAKIMVTAARYDEALTDVEAALVIEPIQPLYHLTRGEILGRQGNFEEAGQETKDVLTAADLPDLLKARAMCQLGDLLAASPAHDYKLAMEHHASAVKTADPLSVDKKAAVRRAAKQLLIDAHLAAANDIACGYWQQKETAVAKWLDRAQAYAEEMIAHDEGDPALRLQVARGALAACAGARKN